MPPILLACSERNSLLPSAERIFEHNSERDGLLPEREKPAGPLKGREAEEAFQHKTKPQGGRCGRGRVGSELESSAPCVWLVQAGTCNLGAHILCRPSHAVIPKFCIHFGMTLAILQSLLLPTPACSNRRGLTSAQRDKCSLPHSPR